MDGIQHFVITGIQFHAHTTDFRVSARKSTTSKNPESVGRSSGSKFPAEGAVLEGGEEGVQFGEVGALRGLLALDGFDDGGEFLLEGECCSG
jgi:hypothetical protein